MTPHDLNLAIRAGAGIFPERFVIMGMDREVDRLVGDANAVFKKYAK